MKAAKIKNRIISLGCLGVFLISLVLAVLVVVEVISSVKERNALLKKRDELIAERDWQQRNDSYSDDDYLSVYVKDNYAIYNSDDVIFIFTK